MLLPQQCAKCVQDFRCLPQEEETAYNMGLMEEESSEENENENQTSLEEVLMMPDSLYGKQRFVISFHSHVKSFYQSIHHIVRNPPPELC